MFVNDIDEYNTYSQQYHWSIRIQSSRTLAHGSLSSSYMMSAKFPW